MPPLDINQTIQLIIEAMTGKKAIDAAFKELINPYKTFAIQHVKNEAVKHIESAFNKIGLSELSNTDFCEQIVSAMSGITLLVHKYCSHSISKKELISGIQETDIQGIIMKLLTELGIPQKLGAEDMSVVLQMSPAIIAFTASMAAASELQKALNDLALAKEERKKIEAACAESISMIRKYREEMNSIVSKYLAEHIETFEAAFDIMDEAALQNDVNKYIRGNTTIQRILGYQVQFTTQGEFDDLMNSENAFTL